MKNNSTLFYFFIVFMNLVFFAFAYCNTVDRQEAQNKEIKRQIERTNYKIDSQVTGRLDFFEGKYYWVEKSLSDIKVLCK